MHVMNNCDNTASPLDTAASATGDLHIRETNNHRRRSSNSPKEEAEATRQSPSFQHFAIAKLEVVGSGIQRAIPPTSKSIIDKPPKCQARMVAADSAWRPRLGILESLGDRARALFLPPAEEGNRAPMRATQIAGAQTAHHNQVNQPTAD
ncbi:hypothetical protein BDP55DRAFT_634984 [Colletotrichum godetiae]|uniref:Uncharacterized protein n=1 Tax=Colletotrichum godetiae TaxID=1209918 RepID=A0AAJ0AEN7_9PEZI|nr:uncharacterized protein BDP55DRAFT_634984 [Colletotrichum godetiae]KAK1672484.1 hypothetical protein BDP55DRAFT_634984 [Colletotrichum godetiae]